MSKLKLNHGFTLIEIIVSASIVSIIMSVVFFNYSAFNDRLTLSAAGQEIAIAIRQAQTFGLSVKKSTTASDQFASGYGIVFDIVNSPNNYYVFVDTDGNKKYDVGSGCGSISTECVEKFTLRNGITVSDLCNATTCPPSGSTKMMDVVFLRPKPDALIYFTDSSGNILSGPLTTGKVVLRSPKNNTLTVTVESTGQILVQ